MLSQAAVSLVSFKEASLDLPAILMLSLFADLLSSLLSLHGEVISPRREEPAARHLLQ